MRAGEWRSGVFVLLLASAFFHFKLRNSSETLGFLRNAADQLGGDLLAGGPHLDEVSSNDRNVVRSPLLQALRKTLSPAILLLNKHALKITLNFLCNLKQFEGALDRVVVFAFDYQSKLVIRGSFPNVQVVFFRFPQLEDTFAAGDGRYQLFQYFRARMSAFLTSKVDSFWMIQADTIWRRNLFEVIDEKKVQEDLLFDSEGRSGLLADMIAGGYFFVKSSERTGRFFSNIADTLLDYYATDNNLMARQCHLQMFGTRCAFIPYNLMANWRYTPLDDEPEPPFLQMDGGENSEDKFQQMDRQGALFVDPSTLSEVAWPAKCLEEASRNSRPAPAEKRKSKANWAIRISHAIFEGLCWIVPGLKTLCVAYLFPFYAYYLAV
ncbi:Nucleotid-trans domain-containing protein [Aphelenchoides fujianensis]|nr:Nucleotid-trans domain-containing protein [Aphelenchoides fujianensis]